MIKRFLILTIAALGPIGVALIAAPNDLPALMLASFVSAVALPFVASVLPEA